MTEQTPATHGEMVLTTELLNAHLDRPVKLVNALGELNGTLFAFGSDHLSLEGMTQYFERSEWAVFTAYLPEVIPTEPGAVIAIGDWWLVKLRGYDQGAEGGWEFLPVPRSVKPSVRRSGQADQCVYSNDWVRAEVDQAGSFIVISAPKSVSA